WLDTRLALERNSIDQIVREEVQRQSAMNVTVRNVITSMRMVSMVNWAEFFESVSPVDKVLRTSSSFAAMDFPTRDNYRRAVEGLARGSGQSEIAVAQRAVAAAEQAARNAKPDDRATLRECDPGFYLIGPGRRTLERALTCRVPIRTRIFRLNSRLGVLSYIGMIAIVTALVLAPVIIASTYLNVAAWVLAALAVAALVPASDVAVAIVNRIITRHVGPTLLPSMALRDGVPADLATIIVVPTILGDMDDIARQVERLEVHHLSNPDANFCYALLSDWRDWKDEHAPDDDRLLAEATEGIARLNAHYVPPGGGARFFLLHRRRLWNAGEDKWIGWERKRGKLHELNRLLRGAGDTTFITADGSTPSLPQNIRYVITLDADTRLPIGAARRMVGKMAHPLNQPYFDARKGRVAHGHGILQPRVTPSLPLGDQGSLYQRVFSGPDGLDPYALAVSDVYQDLFEEGSYSGKGIYEIDTFEAALEGQIPECSVLSHDLLEGILARAGLASDIEVVEEFPSRYNVAAARQHRWVRGDWQLLPWIFGFGARWRRNGKT
ncbi:MAG: glycosyl transferase, partial [Alphaproteobacteria bacterium]|nr:glycosyl transferase [Alphaproteobacteria bacterium]